MTELSSMTRGVQICPKMRHNGFPLSTACTTMVGAPSFKSYLVLERVHLRNMFNDTDDLHTCDQITYSLALLHLEIKRALRKGPRLFVYPPTRRERFKTEPR
jgi:hypothetical protein